jgi:hypothetical protein
VATYSLNKTVASFLLISVFDLYLSPAVAIEQRSLHCVLIFTDIPIGKVKNLTLGDVMFVKLLAVKICSSFNAVSN